MDKTSHTQRIRTISCLHRKRSKCLQIVLLRLYAEIHANASFKIAVCMPWRAESPQLRYAQCDLWLPRRCSPWTIIIIYCCRISVLAHTHQQLPEQQQTRTIIQILGRQILNSGTIEITAMNILIVNPTKIVCTICVLICDLCLASPRILRVPYCMVSPNDDDDYLFLQLLSGQTACMIIDLIRLWKKNCVLFLVCCGIAIAASTLRPLDNVSLYK